MAKLTIEEAAALGLLGPDELAKISYNPFMPRAGASWTPRLGVRPGLSSRSFFRYPQLFSRPSISPLRFGLGGLGQGLTLSPESPALGLAGVAAPVGRAAGPRSPSYGVAGGVAGGIAGGRAGIGAEGSGNRPPQVMTLPDGRRLVRYPDGRQVILGAPGTSRPPIAVDSPAGMAELQALGMIGRGAGMAQQLARLFNVGAPAPGRTEGPGGVAGGVPGGTELAAPGGPLDLGLAPPTMDPEAMPIPSTQEEAAFLEANRAPQGTPPPDGGALTMSPAGMAALGELGINTDLLPGGQPPFDPTGAGKPRLGLDVSGLEPFIGPGPSVTGDVPQMGSWTDQPPLFEGVLNGAGKPGLLEEPGGDLSLSPAFYAPGGGSAYDVLSAMNPSLQLRPEDIMGMLPAPAVGPGRGRDLDPRGMGALPNPADIFAPQPEPTAGGGGLDLGNTLALLQGGVGVGQGALMGDPAALVQGLLKTGVPLADILRMPALQTGASAGLGILNALQGIQGGNWQQAISGGGQTLGSLAALARSSPATLKALNSIGITPGLLGAVGPAVGGLGGLLGLAGGVQGLASGDPRAAASSITQLGGGALSTYQALQALFPEAFGATTGAAAGAAGAGAGLAGSLASGLLWAGFGQGDPTGGTQAGAATAGLATTAAQLAAGGSSLAAPGGALAGPLAVAAPIVAFIVSYIGAEQERAARNAGWANNPIKGALYSNAVSNVAAGNKILTALQKTGSLEAVPTRDLGRVLPGLMTHMMSVYQTAQGPRGAVKASDSITGGNDDARSQPRPELIPEYQRNTEALKQGIGGVVTELLRRGVSYEQIGQLPLGFNPAFQSLDMDNAWDRYYQPGAGRWNTDLASLVPNTIPGATAEGLAERAIGMGSDARARSDGDAQWNTVTQAFGGPVWTMMARLGIDPGGVIQEHFDPWRNLRTRTPEQLREITEPGYESQQVRALRGFDPYAQQMTRINGILTPMSNQQFQVLENAWTPGPNGELISPDGTQTLTRVATPPAQHAPPVDWLNQFTAEAQARAAASRDPSFWDQLQQPPPAPVPAPAGATTFNPLAFLSSLGQGQRVDVRAGQDTLSFIPYTPDQAAQYQVKDAGYQQLADGFYAKPSGQAGLEVYLPQDRAQDLGKALTGASGSPTAEQVAALLAQQPVPTGQEAGAVPGAGPASDIAPEAVPAGTQATTPAGTSAIPATGDTGEPIPGSTGFKKGGVVPKTGTYLVHKGEVVIPANKTDEAGEAEGFLDDMRKKGDLKLGGEEGRALQMPKMGPGPLERGEDPTMPDEARAVGDEAEGRKAAAEKGWYVHLKEGVPSQDLDGTDPMVRRLAFTADDVEQALEAGEAPIMVGKGVLNLPPSALRGMLQKAQDTQFKDPMKNPAIVAMGNRARKAQAEQPMPFKGEGEQILRGQRGGEVQHFQTTKPRFPGDRGRGTDVPLDAVPRPRDMGPQDGDYSIRHLKPGRSPMMPMIPTAPRPGNPFSVQPGFARAMRLAQAAPGQQPMDRLLQNIDRGVTAPATLQESIREQHRQLTPRGIMNLPAPQPGTLTPQPGLLEQALRRVTG